MPAVRSTGATAPRSSRPADMDLVGRREIAERAGTTPALVDAWRRRHPDFPAPKWTVSGTPVWCWETVAAWLARSRPTGRPRKG